MKKLKITLIFSILFFQILCCSVFADELPIDSEAAILIETNSQIVLYEKNSKEKMYPASTTKIMTAILVIENCNLDDIVTVSANSLKAIPDGYVVGGIYEGEQLTVSDLLYELLLKSANDVAVVLAEHVSGSVEEFAKLMNEKAKELGCTNTNFVNPNGIHDENHYSTADDLSIIAKYCMKNETFRKIVSTPKASLPKTNKYNFTDRTFSNTNELIIPNGKYYYEYATGIKTGYTKEAKSCLIASAEKDDMSLISVVLGGNSSTNGKDTRFVDTTTLFEYGLNNFKHTEFKKANEIITTIEIENATKETKELQLKIKDSLEALHTTNFDFEKLEPEITLNDNILAPIEKNTVLGTVSYNVDGITYKSELLANSNVEKQTYYLIFIIVGISILILIITIVLIIKTLTKKKRKVRIRYKR